MRRHVHAFDRSSKSVVVVCPTVGALTSRADNSGAFWKGSFQSLHTASQQTAETVQKMRAVLVEELEVRRCSQRHVRAGGALLENA